MIEPDQFTNREREVLQLITAPKSSKVIAFELGLSVHTVSSYRKSLCRKLGAHTGVELFVAATRILNKDRVIA